MNIAILLGAVAIYALFFLFMILPEKKKQKQHEKMITELKVNDDVITTSGIIGRITHLDDESMVISGPEGYKIRVTRKAVQSKIYKEKNKTSKK